jgi:hypothetical protein
MSSSGEACRPLNRGERVVLPKPEEAKLPAGTAVKSFSTVVLGLRS